MSSLYGNPEDYTHQLRQLEAFCNANPTDAAAFFVLGYHYLVTGAREEAAGMFRTVVQNQPKDVVAQQLLDSIKQAQPAADTSDATPPLPTLDDSDFETDLVGTWKAVAGDTTIQLTVTPESDFTWKVTRSGAADVVVTGQLEADHDGIVMSSKEQGEMGGSVRSLGPDEWQFKLAGAPSSDPGLKFQRVAP